MLTPWLVGNILATLWQTLATFICNGGPESGTPWGRPRTDRPEFGCTLKKKHVCFSRFFYSASKSVRCLVTTIGTEGRVRRTPHRLIIWRRLEFLGSVSLAGYAAKDDRWTFTSCGGGIAQGLLSSHRASSAAFGKPVHNANSADLEKYWRMSLPSLSEGSIQPRTRLRSARAGARKPPSGGTGK